MEDERIVALYWERNEEALRMSDEKYGRYCRAIACRILGEDTAAEECVADAYLAAWESIPPVRPPSLASYLGMLTRRRAVDRRRRDGAAFRGGDAVTLSFEELEECLPDDNDPCRAVEAAELSRVISAFLYRLPTREADIFLRRYWYFDTVPEIAAWYRMGESRVKMVLLRTRRRLAAYLKKEGF